MENDAFYTLLMQFLHATNEKEKNEYFEVFFKLFEPLLKKYANMTFEPDNKYLLAEALYRSLVKMPIELARFHEDKYIVGYIHKAIYGEYIKLSKKNQAAKTELCYNDELLNNAVVEYKSSSNAEYRYNELVNFIYAILNESEQKYFYLKFICDYTEDEISKIQSVTRQAVNKRIRKIRNKVKLAIE